MYTNDQPTSILTTPPRIIVIGDIHGDIGRLMKCMYSNNIFNENLQWIAQPKNTIIVQLGDQVDSASRGQGDPSWEKLSDIEVLKMMDKLDDIAKLHGGRVLSLLGNHELMNVMGLFDYVSKTSLDATGVEYRHKLFTMGGQIATDILAKRNIVLKIGKYLFCHGGLLPQHLDYVGNNIHIFNSTIRKLLRKEQFEPNEVEVYKNCLMDDNGILWTRKYMELANNQDELIPLLNEILTRTDSKTICCGHNTVQNITPLANGRLFLVDAGFSRAYGFPRSQILEILSNVENENSDDSFRIIEIT